MAAWGYTALEDDDSAELFDDLSMRLSSRLKKSIKQKKNSIVTRAAVEYLILSYGAGLLSEHDFEELAPLAIERIAKIKHELSDAKKWLSPGEKPSSPPSKAIKEAIAGSRKDMDRQLRFLKKELGKV